MTTDYRVTFHLTRDGTVSPVPFDSAEVAEQVRGFLAAGGYNVGIVARFR